MAKVRRDRMPQKWVVISCKGLRDPRTLAALTGDDELDAVLTGDDELDAVLTGDDELDAVLTGDDELDAVLTGDDVTRRSLHSFKDNGKEKKWSG